MTLVRWPMFDPDVPLVYLGTAVSHFALRDRGAELPLHG